MRASEGSLAQAPSRQLEEDVFERRPLQTHIFLINPVLVYPANDFDQSPSRMAVATERCVRSALNEAASESGQ